MKAIHMTGTGPASEVLQLVEIPEPEITTPTQIKVQIRAAGVNPIDTKLRMRGVFHPDACPAVRAAFQVIRGGRPGGDDRLP